MKDNKVRDMMLIALFAALTAVGGLIKINLPYASITLQILFCLLSGAILGSKKGALSQMLYVIVGLSGIPVFAEGGGIIYILKPSFGYILGLIPCAYIIGKQIENQKVNFIKILLSMIIGVLVVYLIGVPYLYFMINYYIKATMTLSGALMVGLIPFIIPDVLKALVAAALYKKLEPALRKSGIKI